MAPTMVRGEDGREIAEKLGDLDALDLARNVHANTGETVTLVPYALKKGEYVLDEKDARPYPAEQPVADAEDLADLTGAQLDALAEAHKLEGWKKSAKVADKRELLEAALKEA